MRMNAGARKWSAKKKCSHKYPIIAILAFNFLSNILANIERRRENCVFLSANSCLVSEVCWVYYYIIEFMVESFSSSSVRYMCYIRAFRAFHTQDFLKMKKKKIQKKRSPNANDRAPNVLWVQQQRYTDNSFRSYQYCFTLASCESVAAINAFCTFQKHFAVIWKRREGIHLNHNCIHIYAILRQSSRSKEICFPIVLHAILHDVILGLVLYVICSTKIAISHTVLHLVMQLIE